VNAAPAPVLAGAAAAPPADFVDAMAAAVTGVNVVTTDGPAGRLGLTVSAMVSVSADPPLLLVGIRRTAAIASALLANGVFAVNVLAAHQVAIADTFAGRPRSGAPYEFASLLWESGASGAPLLRRSASRFECDVTGHVDAGTHTVVLGTVRGADRSGLPALAYTRRRYGSVTPLSRR